MVRTNRPHSKDHRDNYKKGNPDAGAWKHDLHQSVKTSLLSRISSGSASGTRPSLLDRMSGGMGKELLPTSNAKTRLHGFGETPPVNMNNANAGVELLPSANATAGPSRKRNMTSKGRLVDSSINAALRGNAPRRSNVRPLVNSNGSNGVELLSSRPSEVAIFGASRNTTWVRVDNLAQGTSAEDVVSAFAPTPILDARVSSDASSILVAIDVEVEARSTAEEIVAKYNGVIADGNALKVSIVRAGLAERMGKSGSIIEQSRPAPARSYSQPRQELYPSNGSGKMYSDSILVSDPSATIITLAQPEEARVARERASAWTKTGPSLSQRMGARIGR